MKKQIHVNLYDFENVTAKIEKKRNFNMYNIKPNIAASATLIMFLSACGGGGGASVPTTTTLGVVARAAKKSNIILAQE